MKFTFEGVEFRINFAHFTEEKWVSRKIGYVERPTTTVQIVVGSQDSERVVCAGKASQDVSDKPSREEGRKHALANALTGEPEAFRTALWEAYHSRQGGLFYKLAKAAFEEAQYAEYLKNKADFQAWQKSTQHQIAVANQANG